MLPSDSTFYENLKKNIQEIFEFIGFRADIVKKLIEKYPMQDLLRTFISSCMDLFLGAEKLSDQIDGIRGDHSNHSINIEKIISDLEPSDFNVPKLSFEFDDEMWMPVRNSILEQLKFSLVFSDLGTILEDEEIEIDFINKIILLSMPGVADKRFITCRIDQNALIVRILDAEQGKMLTKRKELQCKIILNYVKGDLVHSLYKLPFKFKNDRSIL